MAKAQLIKPMFLDYQSLTVVILVSTFGPLLVVAVKTLMVIPIVVLAVTVTISVDMLLLNMLVAITTANQLLGITLLHPHIILMILCGMEQDA